MYTVTQDFFDKMKADRRRVLARVEVDYTDPFMDQSLEISASEQANVSYPQQTADSVVESTHKWASLDGSWVLDGSYHLAPPPDKLAQYQFGWWGSQLAGAGGAFAAPYPALTVAHLPRPIHTLRVVGDTARVEYPVDFEIKLYGPDDTLLKTETVTGNTLVSWSKTLDSHVVDVAKQVLTITKWSHAGRQAKIIEFFTSIREVYETGDLVSVRLLEEREASQGSLPVGNISSNEITLALNNEDKKFDVDNENSPLKNLLKPNRRIQVWLGIEKSLWLDFVPQYDSTGAVFDTNTVTVPKDCVLYMDINETENAYFYWIVNGESITGWNGVGAKWVNRTISVKKGDTLSIKGDGLLRTAELRDTMILRLDDANGAKVAEFDFVLEPGLCYLTTVMVGYFGKDDDGIELNSMRALRSHSGHKYQDVLDEYCRISPLIIQGIERTGQQNYYYNMIKEVVDKIVVWVANEEWEKAEQAYLDLYYELKATFVSDDSQVAVLEMGVGQRATVLTQAELETLDVEWVPLGTFWSLDWDSPDDTLEATVTARDRMELLRKSTFQTSRVLQNKSLYELAEIVLQDAGLTSDQYIIDPALQSIIIPYAWFNPVAHREALRIIAEAGLAAAFQNRDGRIQIESFLITGDEPVLAITEDDYFPPLRAPSRQDQVANEITVDTQPLWPASTAEEVYRSNEPITIPGNSTKTVTVFYNQPPVIEATASLDSPPSGVSITEETYYGWGASVAIRNTNATDKQVTLVIEGKPLTVQNKERAIARDEASITENGVLRYEFPANPLVQTLAQAQAIADTLLASVKDARRDIEVEWRGNPALELGDRVTVKGQDYHVIRQEIVWEGALSARLSGRRAT